MEFGSQICRPVNPLCNDCDVRNICRARKLVHEGLLANQSLREVVVIVIIIVVIVVVIVVICIEFDSLDDIEDLLRMKNENNIDSVSYFPLKVFQLLAS